MPSRVFGRILYFPLALKIVLCIGCILYPILFLMACFHFDRSVFASPSGIAVFLLINIAFGAVLYALVTILIRAPVQEMMKEIESMATGAPTKQDAFNRSDELGRLSRALRCRVQEVSDQHNQLDEQREMYRRVFEGAPCIITVQDRDFKIIQHNRYFAERFHVKPGIHCYEAYKCQNQKCPICPTTKTFEDGVSHSSEEEGYYKDGSSAHWIVNTSPIHNARGEVVAAISISLDITPRKRLEEELRKSEKKYLSIFNSIPYAVFLIDMQDVTIIDCNKSAAVLYGYTKGDLVGKHFSDLFAPPDREHLGNSFRNFERLNRLKHVKKDGRIFHVNLSVSRTDYHAGKQVLLALVVDVTERIESEQQLIQANKMATLGEMATGVAHELNQPLAAIQMVADFFHRRLDSKQLPDEESLRTMAVKLTSNADRASRIINHMREFGRKSNLATSDVQVNDVIQKSLDFFSQQLKIKDIHVVLELEQNLPLIKADPNRLEQVFINLLINARDAIEEKQRQSPDLRQEKRIEIRTRSKRRTVLAEVRDTGTGIPNNIMQRLFEPFYTTKKVGKGTGLGLSISYGIVTDYGGTIHTNSREGEGACFSIKFPRT